MDYISNLVLILLMVYLAKMKFNTLDIARPNANPDQIPISPHPSSIPKMYGNDTVNITSRTIVHPRLIDPLPIPW